MKVSIYPYVMTAFVCTMTFSCQTDAPDQASNDGMAELERSIRFELYTSQNFSDDNNEITFKAVIESSQGTIWDSILAPIKVKDIPDNSNKISFAKKYVLEPDCSDCQYRAGFRYEITGVGSSWYLADVDTLANEDLVSFDFN